MHIVHQDSTSCIKAIRRAPRRWTRGSQKAPILRDPASRDAGTNLARVRIPDAIRGGIVRTLDGLFVGSDDGAVTNTRFVSLLASARLHDVEPLSYIRDLFCLLPGWPRNRVLELAPAYWKEALQQRETQQKLTANVFRRVLLDLPT